MTQDPRQQPLTAAGRRYLVRDHVSIVIGVALALAAAGTTRWYNAWVYGLAFALVKVGSAVVLLRHNPGVLNARGTKQAMSPREKRFFLVFVPTSLALPVIAGVDAGAVGWTHASALALGAGVTLALLGPAFSVWALAVNPFFEPTVRIQSDRGHRVCSDGPYRYVRHPGYVGAILGTAGLPLIFGSAWAAIPVAVLFVALVRRVVHEDQLLHDELEGYAAYAERTRFRLLPYVW